MRVFIDTNILLNFYDLSKADLDELRKIVDLVKEGSIKLCLPQQVVDEYWRNRESVISAAIKRFEQTKAEATIPNVIRAYPDSAKLTAAVATVTQLVKDLKAQVRKDINASELQADNLINELFRTAEISAIPEEIVQLAERRCVVGNPPGKKGSLGDAINWEWLLAQDSALKGEETIIVSGDGDFESQLIQGQIKEYLAREWLAVRPGEELCLDISVTDFLAREFPAITLADEEDKIAAIALLEDSASFAATHSAVARLLKYDDLSDEQIRRILQAMSENSQVSWILGDEDLKSLAKKALALAHSADAEIYAAKVRNALAQFEPDAQ